MQCQPVCLQFADVKSHVQLCGSRCVPLGNRVVTTLHVSQRHLSCVKLLRVTSLGGP